MKTKYTTILTLSALMGTSHAVTTLVDFSSATPTPGTAQGGNFWTEVGSDAATNLLDTTDGSNTGWVITTNTSASARVGYGGNGINGDGAAAPFDQSFAIIDGLYSSSPGADGLGIITLSNLSANTTYDFVVYTDRATSWSPANGEINTTVGTGPSALVTPKDALTSFSIISDDFGVAAFTITEGPTGDFSGVGIVLNAMSITEAIPEPATTVLFFAAGAGFLLRRRR